MATIDTDDTTTEPRPKVSAAKLLRTTFEVYLKGHEDGPPLEVTTANPDLVRWDMTRAKPQHKWPSMEEAPMLWATFVAWAAAKRLGLYDGTWDKWSLEDAVSVEMRDDDEPVDPTKPALEQSSESP